MSHAITLTFDPGDPWPAITATCTFTDAAPCRLMCEHESCQEEGCSDPDAHEQRPLGYCNFVEWVDNGDDPAGWVETSMRVTLPVDLTWHGEEGPTWALTEPPRDEPLNFGEQP